MKEGYAERVKQMTRSLEQLQAGKKFLQSFDLSYPYAIFNENQNDKLLILL